jgi:hypothetical protein
VDAPFRPNNGVSTSPGQLQLCLSRANPKGDSQSPHGNTRTLSAEHFAVGDKITTKSGRLGVVTQIHAKAGYLFIHNAEQGKTYPRRGFPSNLRPLNWPASMELKTRTSPLQVVKCCIDDRGGWLPACQACSAGPLDLRAQRCCGTLHHSQAARSPAFG